VPQFFYNLCLGIPSFSDINAELSGVNSSLLSLAIAGITGVPPAQFKIASSLTVVTCGGPGQRICVESPSSAPTSVPSQPPSPPPSPPPSSAPSAAPSAAQTPLRSASALASDTPQVAAPASVSAASYSRAITGIGVALGVVSAAFLVGAALYCCAGYPVPAALTRQRPNMADAQTQCDEHAECDKKAAQHAVTVAAATVAAAPSPHGSRRASAQSITVAAEAVDAALAGGSAAGKSSEQRASAAV
jgi:hypothetical protein